MASTAATGQLAVTASALQLVAANNSRFRCHITNTGASTVYLGNSGVTTATGHALPAGQSTEIRTEAAIYAVAAGTGNTITYYDESEG